jgi:unsaturated rhamnogalacturonyl hydrolase
MKLVYQYGVAFAISLLSFAANAQTVTLDYYFNHEFRKSSTGAPERFHYIWEEKDYNGYSVLGDVFKSQGFKLASLEAAPTAANLKSSSVYIIVDPDTRKENPTPNFIQPADVANMEAWVKQGGVLVMFANDSANAELPHFNTLAAAFGMHFNNDLQNHVKDDKHFDDGGVIIKGNPVFKTSGKIYMKDACSITTTGNAKPVLKNAAGATLIAMAKHGKGSVIAIADPWLYDEYTNGRLPAELGFENDKAAHDLVVWIKDLVGRSR